jgi:beta-mannosidase
VPVLVVHNDSPREWSARLTVARRRTDAGCAVLASEMLPVTVGPRSALTVPLPDALITPDVPEEEFLQVDSEAYWYFREDTALRLVPTPAAVSVSTEPTPDGLLVRVAANALVKDLCLFPDRLDAAARVDTGMVTLAAGESHTFVVTGAELDAAALTRAPVLRAVNDLAA